jgi:hypothetical protein
VTTKNTPFIQPEQLLARLDAIASSLSESGHAMGLLGLGSVELDLLRGNNSDSSALSDPFNKERRIERRQAALAQELPELVPGYEHTPRAALAMLLALQRRGALLNPAIEARIRDLSSPAGTQR